MDDNIEVKEEFGGDLSASEDAEQISAVVMDEEFSANSVPVAHEGVCQLANSSFSAAINMAYKECNIKTDQQTEETKPESNLKFRFVNVNNIETLSPSGFHQDSGNDPVCRRSQTFTSSLPELEAKPIKEESPVDMKQEVSHLPFETVAVGDEFTVEQSNLDEENDPLQVSMTDVSKQQDLEQNKQELAIDIKQEASDVPLDPLPGDDDPTVEERTTDQGSFLTSAESATSCFTPIMILHEGMEQFLSESNADVSSPLNSESNRKGCWEPRTVPHMRPVVTHKPTHSEDGRKSKRKTVAKHDTFFPEKTFTCDVCGAGFCKRVNLIRHIRRHSVNKRHICKVCNASFSFSSNLTRHIRIHTGENPYTCVVCNSSFNTSTHLVAHRRIHTGEKPYACDVCNSTFHTSGQLITHRRVHTKEKPYACVECKSTFKTSSHLITHRRIHSGEKPYACGVCNASFNTSSHLVTHRRIHSGEKPYACVMCNSTFKSSSHLVTHRRIHTGEKPYTCNMCNSTFRTSGNLLRHRRTHTRGKLYVCDVCSLTFKTAGKLATHRVIHTGGKPFACDLCTASFTESRSLARHKRLHAEEKPYVCGVCNATFTASSSLGRHKSIHSGEKRAYACDACNATYASAISLAKHKKVHVE